jgi:serine/threonine-protein kinase RsbW
MTEPPSQPRASASETLTGDRDAVQRVQEEVVAAVKDAGYADASVFAVRLALEEAVSNAVKHGNAGDERKPLQISWSIGADELEISVQDEGPGFEPQAVPDPTDPDRLELPSGRGLLLMQSYMTAVEHNERGNRVVLRYRRPVG